MNALILIATLIGNLTVTSYRAVPQQTDDTPFYTSINTHVKAGGCAISRDLLCDECRHLHRRCSHPNDFTKIHYGDWLYIEKYGFRVVDDIMGAYSIVRRHGKKVRIPITKHIDIFVETKAEEHSVGVQHLNVYRIREVQ